MLFRPVSHRSSLVVSQLHNPLFNHLRNQVLNHRLYQQGNHLRNQLELLQHSRPCSLQGNLQINQQCSLLHSQRRYRPASLLTSLLPNLLLSHLPNQAISLAHSHLHSLADNPAHNPVCSRPHNHPCSQLGSQAVFRQHNLARSLALSQLNNRVDPLLHSQQVSHLLNLLHLPPVFQQDNRVLDQPLQDKSKFLLQFSKLWILLREQIF